MSLSPENYESSTVRIGASDEHGDLWMAERFWEEMKPWLETEGYSLWPTTSSNEPIKPCQNEENIVHLRGHLMHAKRQKDDTTVALKLIFKSKYPSEVEIGRFFSTALLADDPRNHCVPILDMLSVPGYENLDIIVMPFLRHFYDPPILTVGEAMGFFQQIFDGLYFMHTNNVAHRDCAGMNIMMDASSMYPEGFHPVDNWLSPDGSRMTKYYNRTQKPPKYYIIDFGLSVKFEQNCEKMLAIPSLGLDRTPPEFHGDGCSTLQDPFATDVYLFGNMIRQYFLDVYANLDFLSSLVARMTDNHPSKRPSIEEAVHILDNTFKTLKKSELRSRLVERQELQPGQWLLKSRNDILHILRILRHGLEQIPKLGRKVEE